MGRSRTKLAGGLILVALLGLAIWRGLPEGDDTGSRHLERKEAPDVTPLPPGPRLEGLRDPRSEPEETPSEPDDAAPAIAGTSYVVEGRVLDASSKEGVPFPRVFGGWGRHDPESRAWVRQEYEATADRDGRFRLEVEEDDPQHAGLSWRLDNPDWRLLRWHVEGDESNQRVDTRRGSLTKVVLWAGPAFRLTGRVVDAQGNGIPGGTMTFMVPQRRAQNLHVEMRHGWTDEEGAFELGPFDERPLEDGTEAQRKFFAREALVTVSKEGYATHRFDPRALAPIERDRVTITLSRGLTLAGTLEDESGRRIPDGVVAIEYGKNYELRRGARTDEGGRWRLETVTPGAATLRVRAFSSEAKLEKDLTLEADDLNMRLVAEAIRLSAPPRTARVLGLELVQVDDEIRAAYDLADYVHVMVFHPGDDPKSLGIGRMEKGYGLWHVGEKDIETIEEAVDLLIQESEKQTRTPAEVRVVYTFWNESMSGTNTQYVKITAEMLEDLKALRERLKR